MDGVLLNYYEEYDWCEMSNYLTGILNTPPNSY